MLQCPLQIDCIPKSNYIDNEAERTKLVFLTFSIALPEFAFLPMEGSASDAVAPLLPIELY
jgi:hypothetical protein